MRSSQEDASGCDMPIERRPCLAENASYRTRRERSCSFHGLTGGAKLMGTEERTLDLSAETT